MTRWLLMLGLALSLLFNVFFVAGYMSARSTADGASPAPQPVSDALDLDDTQAELLNRLQDEHRADRAVWGEAMATIEAELSAELSQPEPDPERLRDVLARRGDLEAEHHRARARQFSAFVSALSPDQCRVLAERIEHDTQRRRRDRYEHFRRFDTNEDGTLDESERQAAQESMEQRRRDWERQRIQRMQQFDTNGDGELDAEEREALRAWRQEQGFGRPGDGPHGNGRARPRGGPRR